MKFFALLTSAFLVSLSSLPAAAQKFGDIEPCFGIEDGKPLSLSRIKASEKKTYFYNNADKGNGDCPKLEAACRAKAFLVTGNEVLVIRSEKGFSCVSYMGANRKVTDGWIADSALEAVPQKAPELKDWAGHWKRNSEADITIKTESDTLKITGEATYGALDPDRVKRGAVNIGNLDYTAAPKGAVLALGYDDAVAPSEAKNPSADCFVRLRLLGPYLVAEDNYQCGGNNVSFGGLYIKAK